MNQSSKIELKVFFCSDRGQKKFDPGFGQQVDFGIPLKNGYQHESLWNAGERLPGRLSLMNPGLPFALRAFEPHVTLVHGYYHASMLMALLSAPRSSRVFLRGESSLLGDSYRPRPKANRLIVKSLLKRIDGVAAIGTANARFYRSLGVASSRVFTAPYSVDNEYFQARASKKKAEEARASLAIPDDAIVLGFVGKLSDVKGCRELLASFQRLKRSLPNVHLVFVGDGPHGEDMRRSANACERTHMVGFQPQEALATWYQMFDIFVLPSLFEPWGLVVNEAMNFSVPVLGSDRVGAVYDLVDGHDTGWVFKAGDERSLDQTLLKCASMSRSELRQRGKAAQQRVNRWGFRETIAGFESIVES